MKQNRDNLVDTFGTKDSKYFIEYLPTTNDAESSFRQEVGRARRSGHETYTDAHEWTDPYQSHVYDE